MKAIIRAANIIGNKAQLARALGTVPQVVSQWVFGRRPIPAAQCVRIESLTRGFVSAEELRPDLNWVRIADPNWSHPQGRPLVDFTKAVTPA